MDQSLLLSYPQDLTVSPMDDGEVVLQTPSHRLSLGKPHPLTSEVLPLLLPPGVPWKHLVERAQRRHAGHALAHLFHYLQFLSGRGMLRVVVRDGARNLATLAPAAPCCGVISDETPLNGRYLLSRFAFCRRVADETVIESPLSASRVVLQQPALAGSILSLTEPVSCRELAAAHPDIRLGAIQQLTRLLLAAQVLVEVNDQGLSCEEESPELQAWEFHDLLFHTRSRQGRHAEPMGATFRMSATQAALPAVKPCDADRAIPLCRPDLARLRESDPPLAEVMEQRCSIRQYDRRPMTAEQLGEFLYRIARVKDTYEIEFPTPFGTKRTELTDRPYPSGGALYPLELYPVVCNCAGLDEGLYHYDPLGHRLAPISALTAAAEKILQGASHATGILREDLQVLLVMTARFRRVSWKYSTLAYSLILKEVGIAMQNMYLAATAMGLAPCAIGIGDSDLFAQAISSDYYAETSVGELVLGSRPESFDQQQTHVQSEQILKNKRAVLNGWQ